MRLCDELINNKLPNTFVRNGKQCYLDPYRNKLIQITPEEKVRQVVSKFFEEKLFVPKEVIFLEAHLTHYGIRSNQRVDILIHYFNEEGQLRPIALIECKSENTQLTDYTSNQAIGYADQLECNYVFITNGIDLYACAYNDEKNDYFDIEPLITYEEMIKGKTVSKNEKNNIERTELCKIVEAAYDSARYTGIVGDSTDKKMSSLMVNIFDAFLDSSETFVCEKSKIYRMVEDLGIRYLSFGDSGGGSFTGPYRSFIIESSDKNNQIVSFSISRYCTEKSMVERTSLNVAIDDFDKSHHSLLLVVDTNVSQDNEYFNFYHSGRIGIGNIGSGKIEGLKDLIKESCPELLVDEKIYFGRIKNDRLLSVNDIELNTLISNLIDYAIIRDSYRECVKANKKQLDSNKKKIL